MIWSFKLNSLVKINSVRETKGYAVTTPIQGGKQRKTVKITEV